MTISATQALRQALAQDALRKLAEIDHELGLYIDDVNTSQKRVDKTAKCKHETGVCQHSRYSVDVHEQTGNCYDCGAAGRMKFVVDDTAPPKRECCTHDCNEGRDCPNRNK
jgi:hypothetical protein